MVTTGETTDRSSLAPLEEQVHLIYLQLPQMPTAGEVGLTERLAAQ
jgi:hypothetical protein